MALEPGEVLSMVMVKILGSVGNVQKDGMLQAGEAHPVTTTDGCSLKQWHLLGQMNGMSRRLGTIRSWLLYTAVPFFAICVKGIKTMPLPPW